MTSNHPHTRLGIPKKDYDQLNSYQHGVIDWAVSQENLHFKNQSENVLDMMGKLEIFHEYEMAKKDQYGVALERKVVSEWKKEIGKTVFEKVMVYYDCCIPNCWFYRCRVIWWQQNEG